MNITEEKFKATLLPSLRQDPLIDRALFSVIYSFNRFESVNVGFMIACQVGSLGLVTIMIGKGITIFDDGLWYACCGGQLKIVKYLTDKGASDYDMGIYAACRGGHKDIVQFFIDNYYFRVDILDHALKIACREGKKDMALFLIQKGATNLNIFLTYFPDIININT